MQQAYVFGEELMYWTAEVFPAFMLWLNKYNIPGTVFIGKLLFLPDYNVELYVVIGKSFQLPYIPDPTAEEVDKYHQLYVTNVVALFNKYKGTYAVDGEKAVLELL